MKKIFLLFLIFSFSMSAQNDIYEKTKTIDSTIEVLYEVISGDKGVERDWDLFLNLFHKDAKLIPSGPNQDSHGARFLSPQEYVESSGKWLFENGFHEVVIKNTTEIFGNIAHVFSSYESFRSKSDKIPFLRGINSIQMMYDNERWYIINIFWMQESEKNQIPIKYLN
jgi:hypothetical protein